MRSLKISIVLFILLFFSNCKTIGRFVDNSGVVFTAQIETDEQNKNEVYQQVINVLESRANAVGIDAEFTLDEKQPGRFTAVIYRPDDIERIKKFLFTTYRLELKKVVSPPNPSPVQTFVSKEEAEKQLAENQLVLPYQERAENSAPLYVIVVKDSVVSGKDIRSAYADSVYEDEENYRINFSLTKQGGEKLGDWTGKNINNYLAVVLNDEVRSVAYIRSQIFDQGQIDGRFTKESAEEIALNLNSGYMPANIKLISKKSF